ncbi:MAG: sigma-70 family RNA polymerase sigma factor [Planctomycetota bacterium]
MAENPPDVTKVLADYTAGASGNTDQLFPLIYDELKAIARHHLRGARPDGLLQPTALVHEVYLRLVDETRINAEGRRHFLALAARTLRRVLVDHIRAARVGKRGGDRTRVTLGDLARGASPSIDLLELEEALNRLHAVNPRRAQVVELRFFGGFSIEETAKALGVSARTVKDDWTVARAFLFRDLHGPPR